MQKTTPWRRRALLLTALVPPLAAPIDSLAQSINSQPMPKDPKEILLLAAKSNNLIGEDVRPWHLKASFIAYDEVGIVLDEGTYEEYWAGVNKVKIIYAGSHFTQSYYRNEAGAFRSGVQTKPPAPLDLLMSEFTQPVFVSPQQIGELSVEREKQEKGNTKFVCVKETGFLTRVGFRSFAGPAYCLGADQPILQSDLNTSGMTQFSRSEIRTFQGRFIPQNLIGIQNGKPTLKAHLDVLEEIEGNYDAEFNAPPDAKPVSASMTVNLSAEAAEKMLIKGVAPQYPPDAKLAGISGTVLFQAVIGTDGHIKDLYVIQGPPELRQPAQDAVRTWVYKPYLLDGKPLEVNTTISVVFNLNR